MPDPVEEVRGGLASLADPDRAPQMQAYMKSAMPFRGVSAQPLRVLCREVYANHRLPDRHSWEDAVRRLWDEACYREERYAALALARHRYYREYQDPRALGLYRHLVVTGAWWDFVDDLASHHVGDVLARHRAEVTPVIRDWAVGEDMWLRRTAMLCQLGHRADTDTALLDHVVANNLERSLHGREFFVRKAAGWALREFAKTDPGWVRRFMDRHGADISGLTRREATKHLPTG
jgi:3-methyladenine DNA glycosylase AlkD